MATKKVQENEVPQVPALGERVLESVLPLINETERALNYARSFLVGAGDALKSIGMCAEAFGRLAMTACIFLESEDGKRLLKGASWSFYYRGKYFADWDPESIKAHKAREAEKAAVASLDKDMMAEIANGQMIPAIKLCRERTGMGLKEAKEYAERLRDGRK